jgi:membrane-associated phospholipid phosphatase
VSRSLDTILSSLVLALGVHISARADDAVPAPVPPDEVTEPAHGDPNAAGAAVAESPSDVVRALHAAARAGDVHTFTSRLSARFVRDVARLDDDATSRGEPGAYDWPVFMSAIASEDFAQVDENLFYERASVRATTTSDRAILFRLVLEDGMWKVDLPRDLEATVVSLDAPPVVPLAPPSDAPTLIPDTVEPPLLVAPPPDVIAVDAKPRGFFDPGSIGHYTWYAGDWLFVGASATMLAFDLWSYIPPIGVLIGPSFDLQRPDGPSLFDRRLDGVIGKPYLQEMVPPWGLAAVGATAVVSLAVVDVVRHMEFHHTHAFVLGALTATMLAADLTELTKIGVGRLRPDFRDRYSRAACAGYVEGTSSVDCDTVGADGFVLTQRDVIDGMKSFPSSHASTAFALATYLSLYLGGEWVWGSQAPALAMPIATFAMGLLGAGAAFVAASRVTDNRHHLEDVVVGAGLGMASGAAGYFIHFDADGDARWRSLELAPMAIPGASTGFGLRARF